LQKQYNLDVTVDEIAKSPEKFLQIFREKIAASSRPLNDIFKAIDVDGNGLISYKEFKNAMD
jgi:Ca2+-binding EF-hand superfamily protein